ncbi:hypothetical protein LPJ61_003217 [Coemansia biformis]|uniref:26S proteasome non-ATPase regulatory subunit 5 n=1 Tax=Coemansia biformis TaxID=1286918 RepID=A0A9W7YBU1_9FUNG|nr:hypothetical protein LPJ61_003217 [Coemansia biformis]
MPDKEHIEDIRRICELLQSDPTPDVIQGLREGFASLSKHLKAGPFMEVFEATLGSIPFSALFSLLTAPDNRLIVTVAEVTGQLLKPVTWAMVHETFEEYIVQGLDHPHPVVKILVLNQLLKCKQTADPLSHKYGPHIWRCLEGKDDNDVTRLARQVLVHLCEVGMALDHLLSEDSVAAVRTLLAGCENQRFRVYDVVVAAIRQSDSAFEFFRQEGVVDLLLREGDARDVLVAMNFYELVPALCASPVPFEYLEAAGVFGDALEQVRRARSDDTATDWLFRLSALKLFTRMVDAGGVPPAVFLKKYPVAPELAALALLPDATSDTKATAVACIGTIGSNAEALGYLAAEKSALGALAAVYNGALGTLRIECLRAISCVFGHSPTPSDAASQACYELYAQLDNGQFIGALVKEVMKGFEESCVAALSVVQKLALHAWGVHEIAGHQNMVSFLLKRDSSRVKVAQQWQFAAIQSIVSSPEARAEFDGDTFARLDRYVREGPYFVSATARVALEST